jgi:hypothetical protein
MKRIAIIAALMLTGISSAFAAGSIAERVVNANGYVLTLQLSDQKADAYTRCKHGDLAARMLSAREGDPNSTRRINLGCWLVNRDGSVEYSGVDENTGQDIYMRIDASNFKQLAGFKTWGDYMGPFMLSDVKE